MPNALTLDDMSPRLRKVVGRESPRVTSTEEPDGGNLLVRIWRGAGVGNLPAYSTTAFSTARVPHPVPPCSRWCTRQGVPFSPRATGSRTGAWGFLHILPHAQHDMRGVGQKTPFSMPCLRPISTISLDLLYVSK